MVKARKKKQKFKKAKNTNGNPKQYKKLDEHDNKQFFTIAIVVTVVTMVLVYFFMIK